MKQLLILILLSTIQFNLIFAEDNKQNNSIGKAKAKISQFHFLIGKWQISNLLRQHDGSLLTRDFIVNSKYSFDGLAIESHWSEAGKSNNYVGTVLRTFSPQTDKHLIYYFDASISEWSTNEQSVEVTPTTIVNTNKGKDRHGSFKQKTVFTLESENEYQMKTERLYDGLEQWMVIDAYTAKKI